MVVNRRREGQNLLYTKFAKQDNQLVSIWWEHLKYVTHFCPIFHYTLFITLLFCYLMGYKMRVLARIKLNWQMLQQKCLNLVMRQQKNMYKKFKVGDKGIGKTPLTPLFSFQVNFPFPYHLKISGNYQESIIKFSDYSRRHWNETLAWNGWRCRCYYWKCFPVG